MIKDEKPTIVFVSNFYLPTIGGITSYVGNLSDELKKRGYNVHIAAFPHEWVKKEERLSKDLSRRILHEFFVLIFTLTTLFKIFGLGLRGKRIIVHSQSASFCLGIGVAAQLLGAKLVHTFHSPVQDGSIRLRFLLHFSKNIVCVSNEHKKLYKDQYGIPENTKVIPGGVNHNFFSLPTTKERELARKEIVGMTHPNVGTDNIITYVGRITEDKGIDILLKAAKEVSNSLRNTTFLVVGPLDQTKTQIEYVNELKRNIVPKNHFYLLGRTDANGLKKIYHASDLLIVPSIIEEASPMVVGEAMASGLPVIASSIGGLKSMVINGFNGLLINPGDSRILASSIIDLLHNQSQLKKMGLNAKDFSITNLSKENMTNRYEEIYYTITTA